MTKSMDRWNGKVAVVTGASSGIGAKISEKLVECGVRVIGLARRIEKIEEQAKKLVGKKGQLFGLKVDMSDAQQILDAFKLIEEKYGLIHILVNNAGISENGSLCDGDFEKWKRVMDVNVIALCIASRQAIENMRQNNIDGHIIHINSIAGHTVPSVPGMNIYSASKHAARVVAETQRIELVQAGSKIRITNISPGVVNTDIFESGGYNHENMDKTKMLFPEDVADAAIYVLSTPPHVQVQELTLHYAGQLA